MPKKHSVKIYTTTWCAFCKAAKQWMNEKGIKFSEVNVETDQKAAREMVKLSGQTGVPVIIVDKEIVVGFDRPKLQKLLGVVG